MNPKLADYLEWDIKSWSKALSFWEKHIESSFVNQHCLELGGRRGGLSLWLAEKGANVICSDIENPEKEAGKFHEKFNIKGNISYEAIDATNIPYKNEFDIVILKSIIGGIARNGKGELKSKVIKEIYESLKPGGYFLFAENMEASGLHKFFRKKFVRWGDEWNYLKYQEINKLLSQFSSFEVKTNGFLSAFGRKEWQRNILAFFDVFLFNKIIPARKKYILSGIAKKK